MSENSVELAPLNHFLLIFDRQEDKLIVEKNFGTDDDAAYLAYCQAEGEYLGQSRYDVLLVGSDSLETVKVTHSNYFPGCARRRVMDSIAETKRLLGIA